MSEIDRRSIITNPDCPENFVVESHGSCAGLRPVRARRSWLDSLFSRKPGGLMFDAGRRRAEEIARKARVDNVQIHSDTTYTIHPHPNDNIRII